MKDTTQNYICFLGFWNVEEALRLWKIVNLVMARQVIALIPDSNAATQFLLHARRGELPLCNFLPEPTHCTSEGKS
jgi:hypothetical protein